MKDSIAHNAKTFLDRHFHDLNLGHEAFLELAKEKMQYFDNWEDKVSFVQEIIRLGQCCLDKSLKKLSQMERLSVS